MGKGKRKENQDDENNSDRLVCPTREKEKKERVSRHIHRPHTHDPHVLFPPLTDSIIRHKQWWEATRNARAMMERKREIGNNQYQINNPPSQPSQPTQPANQPSNHTPSTTLKPCHIRRNTTTAPRWQNRPTRGWWEDIITLIIRLIYPGPCQPSEPNRGRCILWVVIDRSDYARVVSRLGDLNPKRRALLWPRGGPLVCSQIRAA